MLTSMMLSKSLGAFVPCIPSAHSFFNSKTKKNRTYVPNY